MLIAGSSEHKHIIRDFASPRVSVKMRGTAERFRPQKPDLELQ
jgi:hypothetical protein